MAMPHSRTNEEILDIAIAYVDDHGLDALTLRSLGEELGWHHTAIYRYYPNKSDLVTAMVDYLLGAAFDAVAVDRAHPRREFMELARALRRLIREHPAVMQAVMQVSGFAPNNIKAALRVLDVLNAMGLRERSLVRWARLLESYVAGSSLFDYAGAPEHLSIRRLREHATGNNLLISTLANDRDVDEINEEAFERGLGILMDAAELDVEQPQ